MPPASPIDLLLGLVLGTTDPGAGNRFSLEGVSSRSRSDGALEVNVREFAATALRLGSGPLLLEVGRLALHQLTAVVRRDAGKPRLDSVEAASAELSGVKAHGPLGLAAQASAPTQPVPVPEGAAAWSLGPLATADGSIRAQIVDAQLLFDADVTVTLRQGRVDFNDATVAHVGPDSRMGVSKLGVYVDAPNGRSYLYQFSSAPVAGVEFERRGALLGAWVTQRGSLQLQAFGEWLLRQGPAAQGSALPQQSRQMFERTAVSGEVRLADGRLAVPGLQADTAGRAQGRNVVRLHSQAIGRGVTLELPSLSVREAMLGGASPLRCAELDGALRVELTVDGTKARFALDLPDLKLSGLRWSQPMQA